MIIEVDHGTHVQQMTYDDFEARVLGDEIGPDTPLRFEVVTGQRFVPARDLELYQALAEAPERNFRKALQASFVPVVTAILVGFQVRVFLWARPSGLSGWLQERFTNWTPAIVEQGEVWRLFTYGLLHLDLEHILLNLVFLAYTGYHLERALGRANLLVLYFGSVFVGGVLSAAFTPDVPALGASGGVYGLLAASIVFGWKYWDSIPARSRRYFGWAIAAYLIVAFVSALRGIGVDHWSHMGGLVAGGVLATLIEPDQLTTRARVNRRRRWVALGLMAATSLGVVGAGTRLVPLTPLESLEDDGWGVDRPAYWRQGWTFTGDRGWFSPTLLATFAATTTVHPRPVTSAEAAENLVQRISSGSRSTTVLSDEPVQLGGHEARRLVLQFELSGEAQRVTAFVMARGVYEHRLQFQSVADSAWRYAPLVDRISQSASFFEAPEVEAARQRAAIHPRSPGPALRLGQALYRVGEPTDAMASFSRALELRPNDIDALVGQLRTVADYKEVVGAQVAWDALKTAPDVPRVIVAAAEALAAEGQQAEAVQVLDEAWARLPGDRQLRAARLNWGLSVELPDVEEEG